MEQNIESKIEEGSKKNAIVWLVIGGIVVVILLIIWYWAMQKKVIAPEAVLTPSPEASVSPSPAALKEDSIPSIYQDLQGVDVGNVDQEFQVIDEDLNSL